MKFAVSVADAMSGVSANLPFRAVADDTHTEYALTPDGAAFSVADYARLAHAAIDGIAARGRLPILAGGTGLYIGAVVDNLDYGEIPASPEGREELKTQARERGGKAP